MYRGRVGTLDLLVHPKGTKHIFNASNSSFPSYIPHAICSLSTLLLIVRTAPRFNLIPFNVFPETPRLSPPFPS
jgi:hypothetical protein